MKDMIADWVGTSVRVTVNAASAPVGLDGKLVQVGDSGVMLEHGKGRFFIPVTSIIHIAPLS